MSLMCFWAGPKDLEPLGCFVRWIATASLLLLSLIGISHAQKFTRSTTPWPLIPDPPKSKVEWVSADMRVNGLPMKVLKFESAVGLEELVAYYQAHWDAREGPIVANIDGEKRSILITRPERGTVVISKFHGPFYMTVKARRDKLSTSSGTLTVSLLGGNQPDMDVADVPHPPNARVLSVVESADLGKVSKAAMFVTDQSVSQVDFYYSKNLPDIGWKLVDRHASKEHVNGQKAYVLMLKKADQELEVVIAALDSRRTTTTFRANKISLLDRKP